MKKLITIMMLLFTITSFSQETNEVKTFEETITPYINKVLKGIEQGVEMASEEIPIILKQYIMYEAVTSWLLISLSIILAFIVYKFGMKAYKEQWDNCSGPAIFIWTIGGIIAPIPFFMNIGTAIKASFFLKLFLLQEFINNI